MPHHSCWAARGRAERGARARGPQFPLGVKVAGVWEPTVAATVTLPAEHLGALMALCQDRRGELAEHTHLGPGRLLLRRARGRRAAAAARRRGALDAVFAVPELVLRAQGAACSNSIASAISGSACRACSS